MNQEGRMRISLICRCVTPQARIGLPHVHDPLNSCPPEPVIPEPNYSARPVVAVEKPYCTLTHTRESLVAPHRVGECGMPSIPASFVTAMSGNVDNPSDPSWWDGNYGDMWRTSRRLALSRAAGIAASFAPVNFAWFDPTIPVDRAEGLAGLVAESIAREITALIFEDEAEAAE